MDCSPPGPMGFSRQEYWSRLPFPSPGDLPKLGIEPMSPAWQEDSLSLSYLGSPLLLSAAAAKSLQLCPTLCDPMDCSLPGSSVHGIFRETVLERGATAFSMDGPREHHAAAKLLQLCPTLCDPMDCSLPGFPVPGILQARTVEWVAMPSSRGSFPPRDKTPVPSVPCILYRVLYHWRHLGSPRGPHSGELIMYQEWLKFL